MRPHELTATPNQRAVLRDELHHLIDTILDQLPTIERISREMGRGYAGATLTDGRGGGDGLTLVERQATQQRPDPSNWATQALKQLDDTINQLRRTGRSFRGLTPLTIEELAELEERKRQAEIPTCGLCELPIPDKAHRIDDIPYHANTCYYRVWRARRATA